MTRTTTRRGPSPRSGTGVLAALVLATVTLTGCSGEDEHALGEAVEIDYYATGGTERSGSGTVEVTDVREGSTSELEDAGFTLDPEEKSTSAFYVDVSFENTGDSPVVPHSPGGEDPDGNLIQALTIIDLGGDPFEPCPGVPDEVPAGETADGCTIILVPDDTEMERIYYHPGGSEDFIYWKTE